MVQASSAAATRQRIALAASADSARGRARAFAQVPWVPDLAAEIE